MTVLVMSLNLSVFGGSIWYGVVVGERLDTKGPGSGEVRVRVCGIVQRVLPVCFRRIERLKIISGTNISLHMRRTKLIN